VSVKAKAKMAKVEGKAAKAAKAWAKARAKVREKDTLLRRRDEWEGVWWDGGWGHRGWGMGCREGRGGQQGDGIRVGFW
jgi:hypothetical protein